MREARLKLERVESGKAELLARAVLETARQKLGMIPNMHAYMANAPSLLEAYRTGYELFRGGSGFSPVEQEVIFHSISYENECEYCMAAHSFLADTQLKVPSEVTEARFLPNSLADSRFAKNRHHRTPIRKR